MSSRIMSCSKCGAETEVFVFNDGSISSQLCSQCRSAKLIKEKEEFARIKEMQKISSPLPNGTITTEKQICVDCGMEFEYRSYIVFGNKIGSLSHSCPECCKKHEVEIEAKEKVEKDRLLKQTREDWRRKCGIPLKYQSVRFATWEFNRGGNVDKAYRVCCEYAENYPIDSYGKYLSLILTSPRINGVGKTHLVCSIAHRIYDRWQGVKNYNPIYLTTEYDFLSEIRATYDHQTTYSVMGYPQPHKTEDEIIRRASVTPLLIIDDIGKERVSDPAFVQRMLFRVINNRYNSELPIVLTANLSCPDLVEHLGGEDNKASFDRLLEMTGSKVYELIGKSYRSGV